MASVTRLSTIGQPWQRLQNYRCRLGNPQTPSSDMAERPVDEDEPFAGDPAEVETATFLATAPKPARMGHAGAGDMVGPYRLISELGRGGMGAVWLAERADGQLKRQVALKLPHLVWGGALAERLARERDILASLEHPHIARLYDAGVDSQGRPYLAMEYVEGQPIDVYCRERALPLRRAARAAAAGGRRGGPRARAAGGASRPEARQHPRHRRRPGAAAGFRHRQADGRRPHRRDPADPAVGPRADAGLRQPGADPRRAAGHGQRRLQPGRGGLRAAGRRPAVPAEARERGRARRGDHVDRRAAGQRSGARAGAAQAAQGRPRRDPEQGAEEGQHASATRPWKRWRRTCVAIWITSRCWRSPTD